ncbi:DUF3810 family protein [Neolewinella aurantiaca]|uniref:DUF3810 family protein n=1 Tax=Neolewinella aurantiaca TaxID=2602767 RepID=UPI00164EF2F4|nr:DUF3810 family protein [Neolewinella aurantiaca]
MPASDATPPQSSRFLRLWPVGLLAILLLLRWLLPAAAIEKVYSRGVFVGVRNVWDYTLPQLPVPLFYVFWLGVLVWIVRTGVLFWRARRMQGGVKKQWKQFGLRLLNSVALLVSVFLLAWGFNYGRVEVNDKIGFEMYQPILDELRQRVYTEAAGLADWRQRITSDTTALGPEHFIEPEDAVRHLVRRALTYHGYPDPGRPRLRQLRPRGILLKWSTAGVYWPWAGEGNIDAGLHPLQKYPVGAHELAHAYGFGDEGTCTFWAWLAGQETKDPVAAYAFKLDYWRRIAGKLRQQEPQAYWEWRAANLDAGVRNDLQAIYDNSELYKDIAPVIRDAAYDTYLKAQGIHEGLLNYGKVIQMVEGYRKWERTGL